MRTARIVIAALVLAGLGACSDNAAPTLDVDVVGAPNDPFENGSRLSVAGQMVQAATAEGLVGLDEQGRVIPALADRWIVTDDGLSYIFRLRDGTWPDGSEISGQSARKALRDALARLGGTALALDLAPIAEVRAMAGRVIELRLDRPAPDLLQILAQPELGLLRNGSGGGPMQLRRNGAVAVLAPVPPARLGLPQPDDRRRTVRSLRLRALPGPEATQRFAEGKVDVVVGGRFDTLPLAQSVAGLSRRPLRIDPVSGLFGLATASSRGWLAAAPCREALAMAVDRDAIGSALGLNDWVGTTLLVPPAPGTVGAERWSDRTLAQRRAEAAGRISRCKMHAGDVGQLRLILPVGPGADLLNARLTEDMASIGVALVRVLPDAPGDLRLIDLVARSGQSEWYLNRLSCKILRGPCSAPADASAAAAASETDPARAGQLLAAAEAAVTSANVFIPLGQPVRWSLVRDRVDGFAPSSAGFHPLPPLARRAD